MISRIIPPFCLTQESQTTNVKQFVYTPTSHSDPAYRRGSCSFTLDLPIPNSNRQDYYYRTEIYPGPKTVKQGPVTIGELCLCVCVCVCVCARVHECVYVLLQRASLDRSGSSEYMDLQIWLDLFYTLQTMIIGLLSFNIASTFAPYKPT